jgi:LEA14-like dessication related protein
MRKILSLLSLCVLVMMTGCAALNPALKDPDVKVVGLRVLPSQGLFQRTVALDLSIYNPNKQELSVRSIDYAVDIETIKLLKGTNTQVPALKGLAETPVSMEFSIDIIQAVRLIEHFSRNGIGDKVNYNFAAVIDFSAWLPNMHIDKKGALPLSLSK